MSEENTNINPELARYIFSTLRTKCEVRCTDRHSHFTQHDIAEQIKLLDSKGYIRARAQQNYRKANSPNFWTALDMLPAGRDFYEELS